MKKGKGLRINLTISNRTLYSLISIFILITIGVGVYATQQAASGGTHNWAEVGIPTCSDGQILEYDVPTSSWICGTASGGSQWTSGTGLIYYNSGNVSIGGTTAPTEKLYVGGDITSTAVITANRFVDRQNTAYDVNPASTSTVNSLTATTVTLGGVARTSWPTSYTAPTISSVFTCQNLFNEPDGEKTCAMAGTWDVCFLTEVRGDDDGAGHNSACRIGGSASSWNLYARNGQDASTYCDARCINFA